MGSIGGCWDLRGLSERNGAVRGYTILLGRYRGLWRDIGRYGAIGGCYRGL